MQGYIAKRALLMIPTLGLVALIIFVLTHLMPGDVVMLQLAEASSYREQDADILRARLGLDKPYYQQLGEWLWGVTHFDLGESLWTGKPVRGEILKRLPVTMEVALLAFSVSSVLGVSFGVLAAIRQDTIVDHASRLFAVGGLSLPDFWIGTLILLMPLIWFGYGMVSIYTPPWEDLGNNLKIVAPAAAAIGVRSSAGVMRLTRTTLLEVLRQDYVRTAHAKGLRESVVIYRHALRNALIPVVTVMGTQFSRLLGGTVVVELIFSIPGLGRLLLDSITQRDMTQTQGNIMVIALVFIVMNLIVDLSYGYLDPRIRYSR